RDLGYFNLYPDGKFGPATENAVKRWQKDLGQDQSGSIQLGELVAISQLPTTIRLSEAIAVGKPLVGGEDAVSAPTGDRTFVLVVGEQQANLIPSEATISLKYGDYTWDAVVSEVSQNEDMTYDYILTAPGGGPVCGGECDALPTDEQVSVNSTVNIVPEVDGVGVPAAAVRTGSDGATYVVTESGDVPVDVRGSGQGVAIVDGIDAGTKVEVPSNAAAPVDSGTTDTEQP
ncbi:MAG: peptidoglycan-binding protein, partial [Ancrocorticia sp.]